MNSKFIPSKDFHVPTTIYGALGPATPIFDTRTGLPITYPTFFAQREESFIASVSGRDILLRYTRFRGDGTPPYYLGRPGDVYQSVIKPSDLLSECRLYWIWIKGICGWEGIGRESHNQRAIRHPHHPDVVFCRGEKNWEAEQAREVVQAINADDELQGIQANSSAVYERIYKILMAESPGYGKVCRVCVARQIINGTLETPEPPVVLSEKAAKHMDNQHMHLIQSLLELDLSQLDYFNMVWTEFLAGVHSII
ncbi:hypothetical protein C8J56DRAFT_1169467 [Mycena floridula]|nr:hypothetical protein C8J56DRAFT_1169467 [Mycena floridula]